MATKTVSIDEDAYRRLARARKYPGESFSKVIKRASWGDDAPRCGDLLERARGGMPDEVLDALEAAQAADRPPESQWTR